MPAIIMLVVIVVGIALYAVLKDNKKFHRFVEKLSVDKDLLKDPVDVVEKHAEVEQEAEEMATRKTAEAKQAKEDAKILRRLRGGK